ncbi:MAG: dihydrofolate reductase family protein [Nocardioides sp.]
MATKYYTASSLDGFIADEHNSLEWLFVNDVDPEGPMGYSDFVRGVGALVMGATTYRWLLENAPGEWPYEVPTWVLTHGDFPAPSGDVRFARGDVASLHAEIQAVVGEGLARDAGAPGDIWVVGGGEVAGQFADAGLLDEVWVQYAPVTLGAGSPVLPRRLNLTMLDVARNRDFACARYAVRR